MSERTIERLCVEFRGLSTHYVASEGIPVTFRYPNDFEARSGDWIALLEVQASDLTSSVRVSAGDPTRHRPCDGGLWRTGQASVQTRGSEGGRYVLWYVREGGEVAGRSQAFSLCRDLSEFPSLTMQSMEDHVLIDKLREQSPVSLDNHSRNSSFVLVTEESPFGTGRRQVLDCESVEDTPEPSRTDTTHDEPEQRESRDGEVSSEDVEDSRNKVSSEDGEDSRNKVSSETWVDSEEVVVKEVSPPSEIFLREVALSESTVLVQGVSQGEAWRLKSTNKELWVKIQKLTERMQAMQSEKEALQHTLEEEKEENELLRDKVVELTGFIALLEDEKHQLVDEKTKLADQTSSLQGRVEDLQGKGVEVTEHCRRLLGQVQQKETELKVSQSERAVLEGRMVHLEKQLRALGRKSGEGKDIVKTTKAPQSKGEEKKQHQSEAKAPQSKGEERRQHQSEAKAPQSKGDERRQHQSEAKVPQSKGEERRQHQSEAKPKAHRHQRQGHSGRESSQRQGHAESSRERTEHPQRQGHSGRGSSDHPRERTVLSEGRLQEITGCLRGSQYQCPVCGEHLPSHESEYSFKLHVETCLQRTGSG